MKYIAHNSNARTSYANKIGYSKNHVGNCCLNKG